MASSTCNAAIRDVAQAFQAHGLPDPRLDADGKKTAFLLLRQFRGYTNRDPGTKHQKALSIDLIRAMVSRPTENKPAQLAFQQLYLLGFFFAMRSCENFRVKGERRTHPIRLRNLVFRKNHKIVPHDSPDLALADTISITFEYQKKDERNDTVTQATTGDPLLCPVRAAAAIVQRQKSFGSTPDNFIYRFRSNATTTLDLTGAAALIQLRAFVKTQDCAGLGITPDEIGLHSARASAAMAMHLNHIPVYTIMLLGRWSSDAFLRYIRKQVEEFGHDVSKAMIQTQRFHHVQHATDPAPRRRRIPPTCTGNLAMDTPGARSAIFTVWS